VKLRNEACKRVLDITIKETFVQIDKNVPSRDGPNVISSS